MEQRSAIAAPGHRQRVGSHPCRAQGAVVLKNRSCYRRGYSRFENGATVSIAPSIYRPGAAQLSSLRQIIGEGHSAQAHGAIGAVNRSS